MSDSAQKMAQLKGLLDAGIITQAEFDKKKREISGNLVQPAMNTSLPYTQSPVPQRSIQTDPARSSSVKIQGGTMRFQNPANNYIEEASAPWLWTLLFGGFYFMAKGVWTHAIIGILLAIITAGVSWFIYPFFAGGIIRNHYLKKGWTQLQ